MGGSPKTFEYWPMFDQDEGTGDFPISRVLESTSEEIRQKLTPLNEKALSFIESLPVLFMTEKYTDSDVEGSPDYIDISIGTIANVRIEKKDVHFSFKTTQKIKKNTNKQ